MQDGRGEIGGADNRVAGRDYYENPVFLASPAPSSRPGLLHCPACDRAGLAPTALICPDCGHDFTFAWRIAQQRTRHRRGARMAMLSAGAITAGNLYAESIHLLGDWVLYVMVAMWCCVALIWAQHYWLHMRGG